MGDTQEETRRNFQEALAEHFEVMGEIGGAPIPEPHTAVEYVEVAALSRSQFRKSPGKNVRAENIPVPAPPSCFRR